MTDSATRRFNVRLRDHNAQGGRVLTEASHEAAGVAFAEDWAPHAETGADVAVIVRDLESGEERCFRIDLAAHDAEPCAAP